MKKSQNEAILNYLSKGYTITPLEALNRFGCWRLGGRIWDLRKSGCRIESKRVKRNGKNVAEYSMLVF